MVRVTRVDEDLVVFLVPMIEAAPVEGNMLAEPGGLGWWRLESPRRVLDEPVTQAQVVEGALAQGGMRLLPV